MSIKPAAPGQWQVLPFDEHPLHDTIWAITMGHDGQVYIGLCLEGRGGQVAQLYVYETAQQRLRCLADMGRVTGEPPDSGHATQGKIHFSLCHARDGNLYGATHCTTPPIGHTVWSPLSMWGDPSMGFPGGHIFRHNTRTGEIVDFGVITPNEGIPYLVLDEERERLYGITYPGARFFRTDLAGRDFRDYGRVSSWYPLSMIFDEVGNLYTSDTKSRLIKYDVARDELVFFSTRPYAPPWNTDARFSWITDMCTGPDGWVYGLTYSNDHLFRFDPRQESPEIEDLGPGLPEAPGGTLRCMVADGKGSIYYLATPHPTARRDTALVRYDVAGNTRTPVSSLVIDGEHYFAWRGVCGPDGTLYLATVGRVPCCLLIYRP